MDVKMKTCTVCGETKPVGEFAWKTSKHKELRAACKKCKRLYNREWKWANREASNAYHRAYRREHNQLMSGSVRQYRQKYPDRVKANNAINHAIERGDIIRPTTCERCGKTCKPDGHHPDYNKPLEVQWLCCECHKVEHGYCKPRVDVAD